MKSPIALRLLVSLLLDFKRLNPSLKGIDRDIITIKARVEHEGKGFLTLSLPRFCDALDRGLADSKFACPLGFKKVRGGTLPALLQGLLCEVFDLKTGNLREQPELWAIKCLREALRLFKKVRGDLERDERLHRDAVRTFWETDGSCNPDLSGYRGHLLAHVARYLLPSLASAKLDEVLPRHGPGAVAEGLYGNRKWVSIFDGLSNSPVDLSELGLDVASTLRNRGEDEASQASHGDNPTRAIPWYARSESQICNPSAASSTRSARLVSVYKDTRSRRTITVEPCWRMFFQQGFNTILRDEIANDRVLSNCLALTDQSKNQRLALEGSKTAKWATLDLKSASDLLSLSLVRHIFGQISPRFLTWMIWCRTPNCDDKQLAKFAGMGNALTFPVQSVVFAAIAITAIASSTGRRPDYWSVLRSSRHIQVYGDDIVVRSEYADLVCDWIESFGLKVNRMKSFTTGNFRESCGVDAYAGLDVSPVYVRADPDSSSKDPNHIASLVAASNQFWLRCCYDASEVLRERVEELLARRLPLVTRNSQGLGWISRNDAYESTRWDDHLHVWTVKAPCISPMKRKDAMDGYPALLKFFLTPLIARDKDHLKRTARKYSTSMRWRWIPV